MDVVDLSYSRTFPAGVEHAFDTVLATPLTGIFDRRYGAIPPITSVRGQDGQWSTAGQTRTIVLADRTTMLEELTSVDRPVSFGYRISEVTAPMKLLVSTLDGRWSFAAAGTGVRITWSWSVRPASGASGMVMPVFRRLWRGYARQAMERIEDLLVT